MPWYVGSSVAGASGYGEIIKVPIIGPWHIKSGGVTTYNVPEPQDLLSDGNMATSFNINTYLPLPEVFLNGIVDCRCGPPDRPVDTVNFTGTKTWAKLAVDEVPNGVVADIRGYIYGSGGVSAWNGENSPAPTPIPNSPYKLYPLDVDNSIYTYATYSGVNLSISVKNYDRYSTTYVNIKEAWIVGATIGNIGWSAGGS